MPASLKETAHEQRRGLYFAADDWWYDYAEAYRNLLTHFRVSSLEGYGCEGFSAAISAAGALIHYLENTQRGLPAFKKITTLQQTANMFLDAPTQRNLELTHNLGRITKIPCCGTDETLSPMEEDFETAI
jgi:DNA mismatch repair protein MutS